MIGWLETFALHHDVEAVISRSKGLWSVGMHWGQEAPDSPMVGAATYGLDESLVKALEQAAADTGWHEYVHTDATRFKAADCDAIVGKRVMLGPLTGFITDSRSSPLGPFVMFTPDPRWGLGEARLGLDLDAFDVVRF